MPITFWTFLAGTLALCGVPPFSGFYSKDAILAAAHRANSALFVLAVGVAALTTFYMFRLIFVAFTGPAKSQARDHAHESPAVMTLPLLALAVPSLLAGFWGIDRFYATQFAPGEAAVAPGWLSQLVAPFAEAPLVASIGLGAVVAGFVAARALYWNRVQDPLPALLGVFARWLRDRFYFDELYERLIAMTQGALARLADLADRWLIAGVVVRGTHGSIELTGRLLRLVQTGNLQTYAFLFVAGVAVLLLCLLGR
jgi:NADH-quinone oxidoreductase subunit L